MTDEKPKRLMPPRHDLGRDYMFSVGELLHQFQNHPDPNRIMGYKIPYWQRSLVWTDDQNVRFLESLWTQIPVGTYTFNRSHKHEEFDDVLIDGQQRLHALQLYIQNQFPVFGYHYAQVTNVDRRFFKSNPFGCYISEHTSEKGMVDHYNILNFSGTHHKECEYAEIRGDLE